MADVTQDSKLSIQEFYVAMHLIVCVSKRGLPMPQTLPRELGETAFGAGGNSERMPGQDAFAQIPGPSSQNGFGGQQQQESVPPPKPEGMSAFDTLSTVEDAPLPTFATSTPRSSRTNSFNHFESNTSNSHTTGFGEPSVLTPTGSFHGGFTAPTSQHDFGSFSAQRTASITSGAGRDRTNSASSMGSMSSFSGMAPLPPQQQQSHQLPPRNLGSNERIQVLQPPPQTFSGFDTSFDAPQAPGIISEKPFMGEEEKQTVTQLDQLNEEIVQTLANVERKQTTIEMLSDKLRDLDELRHELVTLVMKREDLRSSSTNSAVADSALEEQTRHTVECSLRSLVDNQKQVIHQLQIDISRHEGELEEAILSAKLQEKLSLESRSPLIDAASPPPSTHDSVGAATSGEAIAFAGATLSLDGPNTLPSPLAAPSAPSITAFSPDATDSSGFNAFSNFDSAPRSMSSAAPSPAAGVAVSSSPFSPSPSPSQSASANDSFNALGDFVAPPSMEATPSLLVDTPGKSPFSPTPSPAAAAASDTNDFDGFVSAPTSVDGAVPASSPAGMSDAAAASPFSPFSPSPSPAAMDDSGFGGFGGFITAPSSSPTTTTETPRNSPFSPVPSPAAATTDTTMPSVSPVSGFESSPFSPSPSPAATDSPAFGGFEVAASSEDNSATLAKVDDGTANLIFSPVGAESKSSNAFGDFGAAPAAADNAKSNAFDDFSAAPVSTDGAVAEPEPVAASEPPTGNLLFSPEPSPAAATSSSGFDSFGDFGAAQVSTGNATSTPAPEQSTGNSPFSPVAADSNDFNGFGAFNSASASASSTSAAEKPAESSGNSPFSPVAANDAGSGFEAFGDINVAPASTSATHEPAKTASASGNSPFSPVAADSSGFGDFSSTTESTATPSEPKPDSGLEGFGDFSAAPAASTTSNTVAATDSTSGNGFDDFGDFSAAPSSTSDGFGNFGNFN
ncbi:unnamed protein product [Phytophthora fragariaefolia]|uniref:Unnamed protein product n=1 Tax=Phytophthora fragariaefolia TaxID=1490495 RepID=A0A9W6TUZ7_9STRA|nr:unnamed protein product [Phytophthora fragariaefolia]